MRRLHAIIAWVVAVAILLAGPLSSLAECLRCPPDCPMHTSVTFERSPSGDRAVSDGHHAAAHEHDAAREHDAMQAHHAAAHDENAHAAMDHSDRQDAHHDAAAHGKVAIADADSEKDCHGDPTPNPVEGPCISGTCGHMDVSIARVLPEGVLARTAPLRRERADLARRDRTVSCPARLPSAPPTEPPRSLSA